MNQVYRIGDRVIIYGVGKLVAMDGKREHELEFWQGVKRIGNAFVPEEGISVVGETELNYLIHWTAVVVGVSWSFLKKAAEYSVVFEDRKGEFRGFGTVLDVILTPPAMQVLKQAEIEQLRERGILA